MSQKIYYMFSGKVWRHSDAIGWYLVSLPIDLSKEIRDSFGKDEEGWGRLKVSAKLDTISWDTAIWFDTKKNTYLLPLKAEIRKKKSIEEGQSVHITLSI